MGFAFNNDIAFTVRLQQLSIENKIIVVFGDVIRANFNLLINDDIFKDFAGVTKQVTQNMCVRARMYGFKE